MNADALARGMTKEDPNSPVGRVLQQVMAEATGIAEPEPDIQVNETIAQEAMDDTPVVELAAQAVDEAQEELPQSAAPTAPDSLSQLTLTAPSKREPGREPGEQGKPMPAWTNKRGGLVRQDSTGRRATREQLAHLRVLDALGRKYNVVFVTKDSIADENGNRANGRYTGQRVMEIALDAQEGAYTYFAAHEMAHYLKKNLNDVEYSSLNDLAQAWAHEVGIDFDERVQAEQDRYARAGQELTQEQAAVEVVGDMPGTVFTDPKAARELLEGAPKSVMQKIQDFLAEFLDTIRRAAQRITGAKGLTALANAEGAARSLAVELDYSMKFARKNVAESAEGAAYSQAGDGMQGITLDSVNALREIVKKREELQKTNDNISTRPSVNAFTSEEIQAARPWAEKFYRELGTKSPFFRAWFGDWRARDTTPVKTVKLNQETITAQDVPRGEMHNADTGWQIRVNSNGIAETSAKQRKWSPAYHSLANIREMLENAVLLDTVVISEPSKRLGKGTAFMHHLYCPVRYGEDTGVAKLYIAEDVKLRRHYLTKIEMASSDSKGRTGYMPPTPLSSPDATDISVSEIFDFVKRHSNDFEADSENPVAFEPQPVNPALLNEDGTPRVYYYASKQDRSAFTEEDWANYKLFRNRSIDGRDGWMRLLGDEKTARMYGEYIVPVYVNAKEGTYKDFGTDIAVPSPAFIKSATDNIGTFDRNRKDIRYSLFDDPANDPVIDPDGQVPDMLKATSMCQEYELRASELEKIAKDLLAQRRQMMQERSQAIKDARNIPASDVDRVRANNQYQDRITQDIHDVDERIRQAQEEAQTCKDKAQEYAAQQDDIIREILSGDGMRKALEACNLATDSDEPIQLHKISPAYVENSVKRMRGKVEVLRLALSRFRTDGDFTRLDSQQLAQVLGSVVDEAELKRYQDQGRAMHAVYRRMCEQIDICRARIQDVEQRRRDSGVSAGPWQDMRSRPQFNMVIPLRLQGSFGTALSVVG